MIFNFNPNHYTENHNSKIRTGEIKPNCVGCEESQILTKALELEYGEQQGDTFVKIEKLDSSDPMVHAKSFKPTLDEHLKTTNACAEMVVRPDHYQLWPAKTGDGVEVQDVIKAMLTEEEYLGYCKANIIKYRFRDKDNRKQDLAKAARHKHYIQEVLDNAKKS